jgi:hypothetical protein
MKKAATMKARQDSASHLIDARIAALADWRGAALARVRALIKQADPQVVEAVKWRKPSNGMLGVPVWEHEGIICTGETYKSYVKLTFAKGAALEDPAGLFNASLEGNVRRARDRYPRGGEDRREGVQGARSCGGGVECGETGEGGHGACRPSAGQTKARLSTVAMVGLVPTIHPTTCSGVR